MEQQDIARMAGTCLLDLSRQDKQAASIGAMAFLDQVGAGMPDVPLFQERVREDAKTWAECAHPAEIEAYLVAAIGAAQDSPLLNKQLKRLAALTFHRMDESDRDAFLKWSKAL